MNSRIIKRRLRAASSGWPAVLVCALLVLLAGARLVVLSLQQHATQARAAAQQLVDRTGQGLQSQLQALIELARQRAVTGSSGAPTGAPGPAAGSAAPRGFLMQPDGRVSGAASTEAATINDITGQWSDPSAARTGSQLTLVRQANRWLVVAAVPVPAMQRLASISVAVPRAAWSVVYQDLDALLLGARLDQVVRAGYDFQLSGFDPASGHEISLSSLGPAVLPAPVLSAVALPGSAASGGSGVWSLGLRPRLGWFPAQELIIDVSLLLLVTWLVALGVRDTAGHLGHLRTALAVSRTRLQNTQQSLSLEIDQRQRLQRSFEHAHYHDSFTGLPNRHYFLGQLDRALRDMRTRSDYQIAVLLIGVDRYKVITDTLGHTAGDELMVQVTRLFDQVLSGQEHVLARWADDELALLLMDIEKNPALTDTTQALQQELQAPLPLRRHRIVVATSIGATRVESGLARAEEVMREADVALSSARTSGGSNLVHYSPAMQNQFMQVVSLEGDLHMALEREEFRLHFQPIVDLQQRRIVGMEALLRWMHPLEGLLAPGRFLSFAEEAGLIVPITRWIIARACRLASYWRTRLPPERQFFISVNLSPAALLDPGLIDYVADVLRETATPADALKFELTENGLISNVGAARDVLDRLHAMGIELMLDDFGTGYSSLSHLQLFPFAYIKLDGPLGRQLHDGTAESGAGGADGALVRAMAQMATTLGLKTIAESVETISAAEALQQIGCQYAQGNAFCAPIDADQALHRLLSDRLEAQDQAGQDQAGQDIDSTLILPALPEEAFQ